MKNVLKGQQGKLVEILGNTVKITKKGLISVKSEKVINIENLVGIEIKKNGLTSGFIKFHLDHSNFEIEPTSPLIAAVDENSVLFLDSFSYKIAVGLKKQIEENPVFRTKIPAAPIVEQPDFILNSHDKKVLLVKGGSVIIVKQQNLLSQQREKTLPIKNISSVEVKKPGIVAGYIQFSIAGGKSLNSSYTLTGGAWDAASDENSVMFIGEENYQIALKIKNYIENYEFNSSNNSLNKIASNSDADEIRKYKKLLDDGIISIEEFELKKKQLLGL